MPVQEVPLPVGAKNISPALSTITRSSKDGSIPVVRLFDGDNFVGEVLEGHWKWGGDIPFSNRIISGTLTMAANAQFAGTPRTSWLNCTSGIYIQQDSYIDVHLEVQTVSPANPFYFSFYLRREQGVTTEPGSDDDFLELRIIRTATPNTQIQIVKSVNNSETTIYAAATITNDEGTFRVKFRPDDEEMDIYFHDGAGAVVEGTDELTLIDDTLDLSFEVGAPCYEFSNEATASYTGYSDSVDAYHPDFIVSYELDPSAVGDGDVKIWDTMDSVTEADWHRVYAENHDFTGDCVMENGLIRLMVDDSVIDGLKLYFWNGASYAQPLDMIRLYQEADGRTLNYPFFKNVESMSRHEGAQIRIRLGDSATESGTEFAELSISLARGKYHIVAEIEETRPTQSVRFIFGNSTPLRWAFVGDDLVGDVDVDQSATNTVLSDNFLITLDDDDANKVMGTLATNQDPGGGGSAFYTYQGDYIALYSILSTDFDVTEVYLGITKYDGTMNSLFIEAETGDVFNSQVDYISDDFSIDSSGAWEGDTGDFTWNTGSSRLESTATSKRINLKVLGFGYGTYTIYWTPQASTPSIYLNFSCDGAYTAAKPDNGYSVWLRQTGASNLRKYVSGTPTELDTDSTGFTLTTQYKIEIVWSAGSISIDVDDSPRLTSSDTTYSGGEFGITNESGTNYLDSLFHQCEISNASDRSAVLTKQDDGRIDCPVTGLTEGRYLVLARVASLVGGVSADCQLTVHNTTDNKPIDEYGAGAYFTLTDSWQWISMAFEIKATDVGDTIRFRLNKHYATFEWLVYDYFLIIPVANGDAWVQDISHNALRTMDQGFRVVDKATYEIFSGMGLGQYMVPVYTDAMAVAAIEIEPTVDLTGILTAPEIKVNVDNQGIYLGASDDFRMYHDGTDTKLVNTQGDLILQCAGGDIKLETTDFFLDVDNKIQFRDRDDSNAVLWELDTDARTLKLGTAADPLTVTINDAAIGGDADAIHDNVADEIHSVTLKGTPVAADVVLIEDSAASWAKKRTTLTAFLGAGGPGTGTQWTLPVWNTTTTLGDSMVTQNSGGTALTIGGSTTISSIVAGVTDYDKFLVSDGGLVKFRTGAEVASDIGAASVPLALTDLASYVQGSIIIGGGTDWESLVAGTEDYVLKMGANEPAWGQVDYSELIGTQPAPIAHVLAASGPHSGTLPLTDLAVGAQGSMIKRGAADWEELVKGTSTYVLKSGASDIAWGQVDYSELSGSQPAPIAHTLAGALHTATGLTVGWVIAADSASTFSWQAPSAGADPDAIHDNVADEIHQITLKGTPVAADEIVIEDSAASWSKKRTTLTAFLGAGGPGTGTQWTLPVWNTATTLGDSMLSQNSGGTILTVGGGDAVKPGIIIDSTGSGDGWTSQGSYIYIGEQASSGDAGTYKVSLTYQGDGKGYLGMGAITGGVPAECGVEMAGGSSLFKYANQFLQIDEGSKKAKFGGAPSTFGTVDYMLQLLGAAGPTTGPHLALILDEPTDRPAFAAYVGGRDNISLSFDGYYDGTNWVSADAGSNFAIMKGGSAGADQLSFLVDSGITVGGTITWDTMAYFDTNSNFTLPNGTIILGTISDTTDPIELLKFNIEREWSFRKRSTGASTRLCLESDDQKAFWIGHDDGVAWAAKFFANATQGSNRVDVAQLYVAGSSVITAARSIQNIVNISLSGTVDAVNVSTQDAVMQDSGMIGTGNKTWVPCVFETTNQGPDAIDIGTLSYLGPSGTATQTWQFHLPLPTVKDGLDLWIDYLRVGLYDADAAAYVNVRFVYGLTYTTRTLIGSTTSSLTAPGLWDWAFTARDCSGYQKVVASLSLSIDVATEIDIHGVWLRCWYQ